ncbi:MAG TPA: DUF4440 domain-containing protein [Microvirga sp.]|jgi:hypothetical protein
METGTIGAILELERTILDPETRASPEAAGRILADGFVEIGASGRLYDKAAILSLLAAEHRTGDAGRQAIVDFRAQWIGADVVQALYRIVRTSPDGTVAHSWRSSLWRMIDGRWQMIFHQGTPTSDP